MQVSGCPVVYPGQPLFTDLEGCTLWVTYYRNATVKTVPLCHLLLHQDMSNTQSITGKSYFKISLREMIFVYCFSSYIRNIFFKK